MFLLCLAVLVAVASAQRELERYNVEGQYITASGLNAGAHFAIQMQTAYSTEIHGFGSYAGINYYCAGGLNGDSGRCRQGQGRTGEESFADAVRFAADGDIDDTINMRNATAWIYHGEMDTRVDFVVQNETNNFARGLMKHVEIHLASLPNHGHGFPTVANGGACDANDENNPINACDYDGAWEMLNTMYFNANGGDLEAPTPSADPLLGDFYKFNQDPFMTGNGNSLNSSGFIYVPTECESRNYVCKMNVHLHPCNLKASDNADGEMTVEDYIIETELNNAADTNRIIMLYPVVQRSSVNPSGNPDGCWDWEGYNDGFASSGDFAKHQGPQMASVMDMIRHIRDSPF